jgi:hypothetical protein
MIRLQLVRSQGIVSWAEIIPSTCSNGGVDVNSGACQAAHSPGTCIFAEVLPKSSTKTMAMPLIHRQYTFERSEIMTLTGQGASQCDYDLIQRGVPLN